MFPPVNRPKLTRSAIPALVCLILGALTAIRFWRPEFSPTAVKVTAAAGWLLLTAVPVALWALLRQHRIMLLVALATMLVQVQWSWNSQGNSARQISVPNMVRIRVVTCNLLAGNRQLDRLLADLQESGADLILLQEVTPQHAQTILNSNISISYPNLLLDPLPGFHGTGILARQPLRNAKVISVAGFPMMQADLDTSAGSIRVVDVHVVAPLSQQRVGRWQDQLAALAAMRAPTGAALLLAGDFNATNDHRSMARLLNHGLRDAFLEVGSGLGTTWPQLHLPVPPALRLDHVLVGEPFTVLTARAEANRGSDHRRVVVDLALPSAQ